MCVCVCVCMGRNDRYVEFREVCGELFATFYRSFDGFVVDRSARLCIKHIYKYVCMYIARVIAVLSFERYAESCLRLSTALLMDLWLTDLRVCV